MCGIYEGGFVPSMMPLFLSVSIFGLLSISFFNLLRIRTAEQEGDGGRGRRQGGREGGKEGKERGGREGERQGYTVS